MTIDFGTDTSCMAAMNTAAMSSGLQLVAESVYRMLITPKGGLVGGEEEEDYGLRLCDYLGVNVDSVEYAKAQSRIKQEILKDERIEDVEVKVTETGTSTDVTWDVYIRCYTGAGAFDLVLAVGSVTVEIVGLTLA